MCSRCRRPGRLTAVGLLVAAGANLGVVACREGVERPAPTDAARGAGIQAGMVAAGARLPDSETTAGVRPGIHPSVVFGARSNPYAGDPTAPATGRQLFVMMNCAGCHGSHAGGGMGPSLRDNLWTYGSSDVQLFSTIVEGRSAGMPAWGAKLPEAEIWQLIAYIRTLNTGGEPDPPPQGKPTVVVGQGIGQPPSPPVPPPRRS